MDAATVERSRIRQLQLEGAPAPKHFIRWGAGALTYAEVLTRADRYRATLAAHGVTAGDRVAVVADTHPDVIVALFGHMRAGVVHVPVNARYRVQELEHILRDSRPRLVLTDSAHLDLVKQADPTVTVRCLGASDEWPERSPTTQPDERAALVEATPDAPALMIYTSGTTGPSKGVVLSYGAVVGNMGALTALWGWSGADRLVLALPLFHVHGLCIGIVGATLHGQTIDLLPAFEPSAVVDAVAAGGSIFMGVPTMYVRLVEYLESNAVAAKALRGARLFTSGSAALRPDVFERFEALTGHQIVERYGMSETLITLANGIDRPRRPGVVGRPVPGVSARVIDDDGAEIPGSGQGELQVKGSGLLTEYWGRPQETAAEFQDGWFRTGDVVARDEWGDFRIVGRKSVDIIKTGGFKVSAREIEDVLRAHPRVKDAAVVGRPDPEWGQAIAAVVVAEGPVSDAEPLRAELIDWTGQHLASFKKPRQVEFVGALPQNALGKVQKHEILKRLGD